MINDKTEFKGECVNKLTFNHITALIPLLKLSSKWHQEPNNYKGAEDCAVIFKGGTFNDVSCLIQAGFICEQNSEGKKRVISFPSVNHTRKLFIVSVD